MGVLAFDGVDDRIKFSTLASAISSLTSTNTTDWTIATLVKRGTPTSTWDGICYFLSGSGNGTAQTGFSISDGNLITGDQNFAGAVDFSFANTKLDTTSPYLFVISYDGNANTTLPRLGWKLGSGGSWTHLNSSAVCNAPATTATMLEIGAWQAGDPFEGWIGVIGIWAGLMSDANKEALDDNWSTSDWYNSAHGTPVFLAELNVAGASVVDLIGNASDLSVTGTTLDSGETLDSWNFDGTGAAVPVPTFSIQEKTLRPSIFAPGIAR